MVYVNIIAMVFFSESHTIKNGLMSDTQWIDDSFEIMDQSDEFGVTIITFLDVCLQLFMLVMGYCLLFNWITLSLSVFELWTAPELSCQS